MQRTSAATPMNEKPTHDPDVWAMKLMGDDELDRFTVALETIAEEEAWLKQLEEIARIRPHDRLSEHEKQEYGAHMARWERATALRLDALHKHANQGMACVRLVDYSLEAIERLFREGTLDQVVELPEFWRLVYHRILRDRGDAIRVDVRFKDVKILDVLKEQLTELLPGFAELHFREKRGNPILAQLLEKLAGR
jgi:hypothetical protein